MATLGLLNLRGNKRILYFLHLIPVKLTSCCHEVIRFARLKLNHLDTRLMRRLMLSGQILVTNELMCGEYTLDKV